MTEIVAIRAREVLDSRGNPTVEADVILESGALGRAIVPSGASTGEHEAVELRDGDKSHYLGKGVLQAVANVETVIAPELEGMDAANQRLIDQTMIALDGTPNKGKLGANAILAVSMAASRAVAQTLEIPLYRYLGGINASILPTPMLNVLNGGAHADSNVDFQEFMIMPVGAERFSDALRWARGNIPHAEGRAEEEGLQHRGRRRGRICSFAQVEHRSDRADPRSHRAGRLQARRADRHRTRSRLQRVLRQGQRASTSSRRATSASCRAKRWSTSGTTGSASIPSSPLKMASPKTTGTAGSIMTDKLGSRIQLVGDDLFVTNVKRLQRGIEEGVANSILIKVNQIGTVTETLDAIELGRRYGYTSVMSHRSGESEDTFIADLAVATGVGQIKTGSVSRTDRIAKYNQLLRIEEELGAGATFLGLESLNYND